MTIDSTITGIITIMVIVMFTSNNNSNDNDSSSNDSNKTVQMQRNMLQAQALLDGGAVVSTSSPTVGQKDVIRALMACSWLTVSEEVLITAPPSGSA